MKWKVRLTGPHHELTELSRSLRGGDLALTEEENGQYYLTSTKFSNCTTTTEVLKESKQILSVLNGATKLALGGNLDVTDSGVLEVRPDGTQTFHMHFSDTVHVHESFNLSIVDENGSVIEEHKPADPVPAWVAAGLKDDSIGKVFRLFGGEHNWVGLYRIFEVIENDIGGIDKIADFGWSSKGHLKIFKHTANSPHAVGDEARHGKEATAPPKDPMLLSEARALVETLVHYWLRSKGLS